MSKLKTERNKLIRLAHVAAKMMRWENELRKQKQQEIIGVNSLKDMTTAQIRYFLLYIKRTHKLKINIPAPNRHNGNVTAAQWLKLEELCVERGWINGLDDEELLRHVRHTAKVDAVDFLTKPLTTDVISGLVRRLKYSE